MENVTDRVSNPFGLEPPCEAFVPGYGDANAHFHVIGDHPGVHGGVETGVPFTNEPGLDLQRALRDGGLLATVGDAPTVERTFLSYLHMCVSAGGDPGPDAYAELEPYFDAELRAIAAHVLLPVGERATEHVLANYTARGRTSDLDAAAVHARELRGSGWLVVPIRDPADWGRDDGDHLAAALRELRSTDYRRESDLGRFHPGGDPYFVR